MASRILYLFVFVLGLGFTAQAQDDAGLVINSKPQDKFELGVGLGTQYITGDINSGLGFGASLELRKSLDHIFSLRGSVDYFSTSGEDTKTDAVHLAGLSQTGYTTSGAGASLDVLVSLNQFKANKMKTINPYVLAGAGFALTSVKLDPTVGGKEDFLDVAGIGTDRSALTFASFGAGIGFKLTEKIALYLEHKSMLPFGGEMGDAIDGYIFETTTSRSPKDDIMHRTGVRLAINLGKNEAKATPAWWTSPLDMIAEDLAEVKARPILDLTDSDSDGIIDMLDQEVESPANAVVDTRGVAMDSDNDGVLDHEDKEPFSAPGYKVDSEGVAQIPDPNYLSEDEINRLVDGKIAAIDFPDPNVDWFLPMINFGDNSYKIKDSEKAKLHHVATVLKQNPNVRVVAKGYTDRRASDCYNNLLSFNRVQATIDYLTTKYGIASDRVILTYGGETNAIIDTNGSNLINRRVEFNVAKGETSMGRPDCGVKKAGHGPSYNGSRSGY